MKCNKGVVLSIYLKTAPFAFYYFSDFFFNKSSQVCIPFSRFLLNDFLSASTV